ncbi:MAG: LPXTG cell wall anchor domain-containing protein [Ruminococcus sp.]|nr:LPXTG cell wall anchor domain-containing protein [Ruminococcus sp.]
METSTLANEQMRSFEEVVTVEQKHTSENPLKTNEALQYGVLIAILVVLSVTLFFRKRRRKKDDE